MINIDGSYGEGGGQILRSSIGLSVLLKEDLRIFNIRGKRPKPGMKPQHYTAIKIIKELCNAKTEGLEIGSRELIFKPGSLKNGSFDFDIVTAGSIVLVFQTCILSLIKTKERIKIRLTGGTDVKWSPSWDYFENVFIKILKRIGIKVNTRLIRRGYYPQGGGEAILEIFPIKNIYPLYIEKNQEFKEVCGIIHISNLPEHVAKRMKNASINKLIKNNLNAHIKIVSSKSLSAGTGITLWSKSNNTILGKTNIGERGLPAEKVGELTSNSLVSEIKSGANVDINLIDQILPFLVLADNTNQSNCIVKELSGHTETNIWLINQFIKNNDIFQISNEKGLFNIKINGINYFVNQVF